MLILILCILCNVVLAVIFKAFGKYKIDNLNAIVINYFTCVSAAIIFTGGFDNSVEIFSASWFPYSVLMGSLFIVGFNLLALAFQKSGVCLTIIISKMSLVLPALFAISLYGESLRLLKLLGIVAALAAIVMVNLPDKQEGKESLKISRQILILPILVMLLSGIIEIILFFVQVENLVTDDTLLFIASSFAVAGTFGLLYGIYRMYNSKIYPGLKELVGGVSLGLPNFLTIYLLLLLLQRGWEGSVLFPLNNVGILVLTAIVGVLFYKEKLNALKGVGLVLAVLAIVFIGMSG